MNCNRISKFLFICMMVFIGSGCSKDDGPQSAGTFTDIDGNLYHTVKICDQVWMVENLKVTRFRNGDDIPLKQDPQWDYDGLTEEPAYCYYDDDFNNIDIYGNMYNWYAVNDNRKLAPEGWHIPTNEEWGVLIECLGGAAIAGGKMKEEGTSHWLAPNVGATNESGFTALPGGHRTSSYQGDDSLASFGGWWTATKGSQEDLALRCKIHADAEIAYRLVAGLNAGLSVRCVKD
jgi:uncharacterized protein (TIGR02145 family)